MVRHAIQIELTAELERYVAEVLASGRFADAGEVVRHALKLSQKAQGSLDLADDPATRDWLRREAQLGLDSAQSEPLLDGPETLQSIRNQVYGQPTTEPEA